MDKLSKIGVIITFIGVSLYTGLARADDVYDDGSNYYTAGQYLAYKKDVRPAIDGFYAGAGGDFVAATGSADLSLNNPTTGSWSEKNYSLSSNNLGLTVYAGYGRVLSQIYYLGGELYFGYEPISTQGYEESNLGPAEQTMASVKSNFTYGAALRGGVLLSDKIMLYALLGMDFTQFKVRSDETSGFSPVFYLDNESPLLTENAIGFMPGIGMEMMIFEHWSLRMQYTCSLYKDFTDSYKVPVATGGNEDASMKYDLARNVFMLGFTYHFIN